MELIHIIACNLAGAISAAISVVIMQTAQQFEKKKHNPNLNTHNM